MHPQFSKYQTAMSQKSAFAERQRQLQAEVQSLKMVLEASEERVRQARRALATVTSLRVTKKSRPSLSVIISSLQASQRCPENQLALATI